MELKRLMKQYGSNKHISGFADYYESIHLAKRNDIKIILEIGIKNGGSIRAFRDFFPNAIIIGIDKNASSMIDNEERIYTFQMNQSSREQMSMLSIMLDKNIDIIIDDGSHRMFDQQMTMAYLFNNLKYGGDYYIEDLNTSLRKKRYDGDPDGKNPNITLNVLKNFIKTKNIETIYLTEKEQVYLKNNINFVNVTNFPRKDGWINIIIGRINKKELTWKYKP